MKFHIETIAGDLILIRTNIPTPPPCPVIARSVKPAAPQTSRLVLSFILWAATCFAPIIARWPPTIGPVNKVRFATLIFLSLVLVEVVAHGIAQGYIEKSLGVIC